MIAAALLALALSQPVEHQRTSYPRVLAWVACAKAVDAYSTGYALRHGADEGNPAMQSPDERAALALAVTALASWAFWEIEKRPGLRWRLPRYVFVAAHLVVGALNLRRVR